MEKKDLINGRLRNTILKIDLEIANTVSNYKLALEKYQFYQKFKQLQVKTLYAKMEVDLYKAYLVNLTKIKNNLITQIKELLSKYYSKYQDVWYYAFIEQKTIEEIAELTNYSRNNVCKILNRLRKDLQTNDWARSVGQTN